MGGTLLAIRGFRHVQLGLRNAEASRSERLDGRRIARVGRDWVGYFEIGFRDRELGDRAERLLSILRSRVRTLDLLEPFRGSTGDPDLN